MRRFTLPLIGVIFCFLASLAPAWCQQNPSCTFSTSLTGIQQSPITVNCNKGDIILIDEYANSTGSNIEPPSYPGEDFSVLENANQWLYYCITTTAHSLTLGNNSLTFGTSNPVYGMVEAWTNVAPAVLVGPQVSSTNEYMEPETPFTNFAQGSIFVGFYYSSDNHSYAPPGWTPSSGLATLFNDITFANGSMGSFYTANLQNSPYTMQVNQPQYVPYYATLIALQPSGPAWNPPSPESGTPTFESSFSNYVSQPWYYTSGGGPPMEYQYSTPISCCPGDIIVIQAPFGWESPIPLLSDEVFSAIQLPSNETFGSTIFYCVAQNAHPSDSIYFDTYGAEVSAAAEVWKGVAPAVIFGPANLSSGMTMTASIYQLPANSEVLGFYTGAVASVWTPGSGLTSFFSPVNNNYHDYNLPFLSYQGAMDPLFTTNLVQSSSYTMNVTQQPPLGYTAGLMDLEPASN